MAFEFRYILMESAVIGVLRIDSSSSKGLHLLRLGAEMAMAETE